MGVLKGKSQVPRPLGGQNGCHSEEDGADPWDCPQGRTSHTAGHRGRCQSA